MITKSFIESLEYQELKSCLMDEVVLRAVKIDVKGKSNDVVAREFYAYELAGKMVLKAIKKFERQVSTPVKQDQGWR